MRLLLLERWRGTQGCGKARVEPRRRSGMIHRQGMKSKDREMCAKSRESGMGEFWHA